jgi:S-adenosylmethionine/arginine decarboxylase-like enzyme
MFESVEQLPVSNNFSRSFYELEHNHLRHQHLIVNTLVKNPPKDPVAIEAWTKELIEAMNMKVLLGPYAVYCDMPGNRGLTCITAIQTSSITLHSWDEGELGNVQLDVYTCSDLELDLVFEAMKEWQPVQVAYKFLDRENGLQLLKKDVIINADTVH